jgi:hypothetical protein
MTKHCKDNAMNTNNSSQMLPYLSDNQTYNLHKRGITEIQTNLIQAPAENNGHTAIVEGTLADSDKHFFTGIGAATPFDINGSIVAQSLIDEATKQSVARAMFFASTCSSSTSPAIEVTASRPPLLNPEPQRQAIETPNRRNDEPVRRHCTRPGSMTANQKSNLTQMAKERGTTIEKLAEQLGTTVDNMSSADANSGFKMLRSLNS